MNSQDADLLLALETSGRHGSVALMRGDEMLADGAIGEEQRTAAALTPLIHQVVRSAGVELSELNAVAVTEGPGSFTGLRVGVTTAKTLGYVLNCAVIGVNTLRVMAQQAPADVPSVWTVLDAQRQQLFVARFIRGSTSEWDEAQATAIIDNQNWIDSLGDGDFVMGAGLAKLKDRLQGGSHVIDESLWKPTAESLDLVARQLFNEE